MMVFSIAREVADGLLSALLSPPCAVCARLSDRPTAGAVCDACWTSIRYLTPPLCARCGDPLPGVSEWKTMPPGLECLAQADNRAERRHGPSLGGPTMIGNGSPTRAAGATRWEAAALEQPEAPRQPQPCPRCSVRTSVIDRSRALGPYDHVLRDLVHALKYGRRRSVAPRLAALLRERCADLLAGADAAVPVPLHRQREWTRGFNQADELACALGLPCWRILRRVRRTRPQADLEAGERWRNVERAFALGRGPLSRHLACRLRGAAVVLVDDVSTTGATLEACAAVLKAAGAAEVRALTVARTLLGNR